MNLPFAPERTRQVPGEARSATAVLGPTNTGKTHYSIERMLAHPNGMIGLPLRLLAREVYARVVERAGADAVALITGEEKIKPKSPRYWVATVEAMPRDLNLSFVAVDEVQLANDFDRGHVFTDRLLNRRGIDETLLIGAGTMQRAISELLPGIHIMSRPRLSTRRSRDCRPAAPSSPSPPRKSMRLPNGSAARRAAQPSFSALSRRGPATRKSRCIRTAMSITSSRPTRSVWGSISTSITWHLRPIASSMDVSSGA